MTEAALERAERTSWQQLAFSAYYTAFAAGMDVPDHWMKFVEKYHPEFLTLEQLAAKAARKANREAELERARREAAEIVQLDPIRAARRKELGLDP